MRNAIAAGLTLGLAVMLLAGCTTTKVVERAPLLAPEQPWLERRASLQARAAFALAGRIAVAAGDQGFSGSMRFDQGVTGSSLALDGPLGVGGLQLRWNGTELAMLTSRGEVLDGEAARAEIERRLGFALPLDRLRFWLLGVPAPGVAVEAEMLDGERLASLAQDGWQISYTQYSSKSGLPERLTAQRDSARVRVILDRWQQ